MADKTELKWHNIDPSDLSKSESELWSRTKDAYKAYVSLRETFEKAFTPTVRQSLDARDGEEVKFSYRFGGLSVALAAVQVRKGKNLLTLKR